MYVHPNSVIKILKNVPLDATYAHTIHFESESAQVSYFNGKVKKTFPDCSYQRVERGHAFLGCSADDIYECNYMMFQNTAFGKKWFYAFITGIEYIANETTRVDFTIDVMQTWYFDVTLKKCYIERTHVSKDAKWTHLVGEPFPEGETTTVSSDTIFDYFSTEPYCLVYASYNIGDKAHTGGHMINGTYYGCNIYMAKNTTELNEILKDLQDISDDAVLGIQTIPWSIGSLLERTGYKVTTMNYVTKATQTVKFDHSTIKYDAGDNYTPRNNKCFNYPYYSMYLTNQKGLNARYDFSLMMNRSSVTFTLYGDTSINSPLLLIPSNYKHADGKDYALNIGTMPQVQYRSTLYNYYQQQELQAKTTGLMNAVGGAVNAGETIASAATSKNAGSAVTSVLNSGINLGMSIADTINTLNYMQMTQQNTPPSVHNLTGNSDLMVKMGAMVPSVRVHALQKDLMKSLDDFFDVYGYQVNHIGTPNRAVRKQWTYIKCGYVNLKSNAPADDTADIVHIYQNGITFWRNGDNVGNYDLDNTL